MKDQYFGDFGDYQKISLLRILQKTGLKILVHWMKTKDDGSTDGKHIRYLQKPEHWAFFEPEIFVFLREKLNTGNRVIEHIEHSAHCTEVDFVSEYIEDRDVRTLTLTRVLSVENDVIFFDPDNGIEVVSTNKKNIHRYITWNEMEQAFSAGKSVVVYQHFSRTNRENFILEKTREIERRIPSKVISIQVRYSVYFLIIQSKHETKFRKVAKEFAQIWKELAIVR